MSTTNTQAIPAGTWRVDKIHSSVGFAVDYMAGVFHGTFSEFDATLTDGVLSGTAKVASVQVQDENLAGHLQSPDFFDAERHPELTFTSSSINRNGDRVTIDGDITMSRRNTCGYKIPIASVTRAPSDEPPSPVNSASRFVRYFRSM